MAAMVDSTDASCTSTTLSQNAFPVDGGVVSVDALTVSRTDTCDRARIIISVPALGGPDIATTLDESGTAIIERLRAIIAAPPGGIQLEGATSQNDAELVGALILSALGGRIDAGERHGFPPPRLMCTVEEYLHGTYGTACNYLKRYGFISDDVDALRARLVEGVRVRAGAFVRRDGRLAIVGRRRDGQSYSVVPGGGVEPGETCAEAAVREVSEELGIRCEVREPAALRLNFPGSVQLFYEATTTDTTLSLGGPEAVRQNKDNVYEPRWADPLTIDDLRPEGVATYLRAHVR